MYQYFYKCDYSELAKGSPNPMLLHVRIYCLACKYEVEALKSAAAKLFRATAETEDFDAQKLTPIIREIYDNTDDQDKLLRPEIVQIVVDSRFDIHKDTSGDFAIMMMELGEFGKDVFFAMSAVPAGPPDDTQFVCKLMGVYFNINLGMVHKSFRESVKCPSNCGTVLTQCAKDSIHKLTCYEFTCSGCKKNWRTDVMWSSGMTLLCPCCGERKPHSRK